MRKIIIGGIIISIISVLCVCIENGLYEKEKTFYCISFCNLVILILAVIESLRFMKKEHYKEYFGLFVSGLFAFLPLFCFGFYYHDDLWAVVGNQFSTIGIVFHRPFIDLFFHFFSFISVNNSNICRISMYVIHSIFMFINFSFMDKLFHNKKMAFVSSLLLGGNSLVADVFGYFSIFPVFFAEWLSALSYIVYEKGYESLKLNRSRFVLYLILSCVFLISACMYYPIITPIVLLFISDELFANYYTNMKTTWKKYMYYFGCYSMSVFIYLILTTCLIMFTGIGGGPHYRGMPISTINEIINKMEWFINSVIPTAVAHICGTFFANSLFETKCMFYGLHFQNSVVGNIFFMVIGGMICFLFYNLIAQGRGRETIILLLFLPLSFYFWIVLKESTVISYYIFPLFFLLLNYFLFASGILIRNMEHYDRFNNWKDGLMSIIIVIVIFSSNLYAGGFWVKYNASGYEFLRNKIVSDMNDQINHIHIFGKLDPMAGDIYSVMAVKLALKEADLPIDKYKITSSDSRFYLNVIAQNTVEKMFRIMSESEIEFFLSIYYYGETYRQYYISRSNFSFEERETLRNIFMKTGLIPNPSDNVLIVDLGSIMNKFYHF